MTNHTQKNADFSTPINLSPSGDDRSDALANLLARDAEKYPVCGSPWFATRVAGVASSKAQKAGFLSHFSFRLRWLLPIPLAGVASAALLLMLHSPVFQHTPGFSSSESEFEQHIEMFASSDSNQENYLITQ